MFRLNLGTEPPTLDWSRATDIVSFDVINSLMVGLTRLGDQLTPEPMLARSWQILDGGKTIVFHLRSDALWSDGKKVRAQDFEYSWKRLLDPETASEYAYLLFDIVHAEAYNQGRADATHLGIRALDEETLEVSLVEPAPYFLALTSFEVTFPQRRDVIETHGSRWTDPEHIVTNGPFLLESWKHESEIRLKPNPRFFLGTPAINGIRMEMIKEKTTALAMYETGQLDFIDNRSIPIVERNRVREMEGFRAVEQFNSYYYGFATHRKPFNDVRVRQAFAMALQRDAFQKVLQGGVKPTTSWIPPGMFGYDASAGLSFDPLKAERLLAEAGYPGGKGFPEVTLAYNTDEVHKLVAEAAQSLWRRHLGVTVRLDNQEWKVYLSRLNTDPPDIFRLGWVADYADPENFMRVFMAGSGNNHTNWKNPQFDAWVRLAARENDPEKRLALYQKAQRLLCERDVPIVPLFNTIEFTVLKPRFSGLEYTRMSRIHLGRLRLRNEEP